MIVRAPSRAQLAAVVLGAAGMLMTFSACTSASEVAAAPSPSAPSSSTASPTPIATETEPGALTIDITIAGGKVEPNGKKIKIAAGQKVILQVTSDEHDEIHAHTDGEGFALPVRAGKPAEGSFTIDSPGSYEVESHHLGKIIAILNVR